MGMGWDPEAVAGRAQVLVLAVLLAGAPVAARAAEPHAVGAHVASFTLEDQHGVARRVDAATRGILLSRDMDGGGLVREALVADGAAVLATAGAVYVADVHV